VLVSDTFIHKDNFNDDKISDNVGLQLFSLQIPNSVVAILKCDRKEMADSYMILVAELIRIYK
jgi:hypothetical protein